MIELYHPVGIEINDKEVEQGFIGDRIGRYVKHSPETHPDGDLSAMWKLWRCGELVRAHEALHGRYDVVVITRFDVKFLHVQPIAKPEENVLYHPRIDAYLSPPDSKGLHYGGYSVQLCWASSKTANILFDMYYWGEQYYQEAGEWHSERIWKWVCDRHGIGSQFVDVSMMVIRGTSEQPLDYDRHPLSGIWAT